MSKLFKVACAAATCIFLMSFMLAYGATTAASAQVRSFEAPVTIAPDVATPVEPTLSHSVSSDADDQADRSSPKTLSELVASINVDEAELDSETRCLATAIFYEARSESLEGQLAVAHVILARTRTSRFPQTFCGVIKQPGQFGFVRGGRLPSVPTSKPQWRTARAIAQIATQGLWDNPAEGALYFHAAYSNSNLDRPRIVRIGGHIFYR